MSQSQARIKGNSKTKTFLPRVRMISCTKHPVGTLFTMWFGSRHECSLDPYMIQMMVDDPYYEPSVYISGWEHYKKVLIEAYPEYIVNKEGYNDCDNIIRNITDLIISLPVPVSEAVQFTFEIDDATVAWRDQLVRGRGQQSYWTQTSRTQDMSTMDINMADSIRIFGGEKGQEIYEHATEVIRETYKSLIEMGVPSEDIRVQPTAQIHRVYWTVNLRNLINIYNKRTSWIAQGSLWLPVLAGVSDEIRKNEPALMKILSNYIGKAGVTIENNTVVAHPQEIEMRDRYEGRDPIPVDPLWLAYKELSMPSHTNLEYYDYLKSMYIKIWDDEYLKILGWDRKDPHKLGKYDRPEQ